MALAATQMALDDAEVRPGEPGPVLDERDHRRAARAATSSASGRSRALWGKGPGFVGAYQSIAWFYAATTGQISIRHGMKGPCGVVVAEGAGGLEALRHSRRTIRARRRLVVSGGTEAPIGPVRADLPAAQRAT